MAAWKGSGHDRASASGARHHSGGPAGPGGERQGARTGGREEALGLIHDAIDAHVDALTAGYLEARSGRCGSRPGADRFAEEIELFVAEVLGRRAEHSEPWLRETLREILVLERDAVYGEVRQRVEAYLRQPTPAA
jgi:hypothetical protein